VNEETNKTAGATNNLHEENSERIRAVKSCRHAARLLDCCVKSAVCRWNTRAGLETSAAIAAISLRASIEFLRAAPDAARVLEPAELRAWGELGRRLTMTDIETGVSLFISGVGDFEKVPSLARPFVFQVCARQMILSANTAAETFRHAASLAQAVGDAELLRAIYEVAASISRRSAKHSAEFLKATPQVVAALATKGVGGRVLGVANAETHLKPDSLAPKVHGQNPDDSSANAEKETAKPQTLHPAPTPYPALLVDAIDLVKAFAEHAGGIAADAWTALPAALDQCVLINRVVTKARDEFSRAWRRRRISFSDRRRRRPAGLARVF
jgi:hypothetical protein